jgi:dTDP-4-dehydrorhamnose reductase
VIVVFGAQGQLGQSLQHQLGELPEHVFLHRHSQDYCGDLTNTAGITETLMDLRPSFVINAAAYTAVDQAEDEEDLAFSVNAKAPGVLAQVAQKIGAWLIHYSTDYVFSGDGERPWTESDTCQPVSVYGRSKRAGEEAIMQVNGRYLILRTSWLYSEHGDNFLKKMIQLASEREELKVVNDQWGTPTHVDTVSLATLDLMNLATPGFGSSQTQPLESGIYHCTANGTTNWFEYAKLVINTAKSHGHAGVCQRITPVNSSAFPAKAVRPKNSRLDNSKLAKRLGVQAPEWEDDVAMTVGRLLNFSEEEIQDGHDES